MSTPVKVSVDCVTGVTTVIELNAEEIAENEAALAASEARLVVEQAAAEQAAVDKASGEAKLVELGLSADEIAALVG
jgi:hypothetical protein